MMDLASSLGKTWCVRSCLATWCRGAGGPAPTFFISIEKKMNESRIFRVFFFIIDIVINIKTNKES